MEKTWQVFRTLAIATGAFFAIKLLPDAHFLHTPVEFALGIIALAVMLGFLDQGEVDRRFQ